MHYPVPNHQQPAIEELYGKLPPLPKTEDYVRRILSLPMFPSLTEGGVKTVADGDQGVLEASRRCTRHR